MNKQMVKARYPHAWAINSAQAKEWVVMKGTTPDGRLGHGATPQAAWKDAARAIRSAQGIAAAVRARHGNLK